MPLGKMKVFNCYPKIVVRKAQRVEVVWQTLKWMRIVEEHEETYNAKSEKFYAPPQG